MNTTALKSFAPAARRQLLDAVGRKLDWALSADTADLRARSGQVKDLRRQAERNRAGLIERVAYTWFNRLAALRFLDARGWHPFGARVLTPASPDETQPELLKLMRNGQLPPELARFSDLARLNDLLDGRLPTATPGADPQGEVYRDLILAACRYYHYLMPFLFEALDDETELLLPDDLLTAHSVAQGFRDDIADEDCAEVEVLGWLYQFYISEKKDEVMARKRAVPSEDIPAVTQLFTPHWIVRYLVENSLGRLWLMNRPASRLREHMPYYVEGIGERGQGEEEREQGTGERGQGNVQQGQQQGSQEFSGSDRVAEGDAAGGGGIQGDAGISSGREVRAGQSDEAGGGVDSVEYRGGARQAVDGGVSQLSFDCPGFQGGTGNPVAPGNPTELSEPQPGSPSAEPAQRNLAHAVQPAQQTPDPSSLTPAPYPLIERPEDIRLLDPACGSGHMLTYAFDLLYRMYEEEGYAPGDIPALILAHNLHGLEICPRAAQLAQFALVCKARERTRAAFRRPAPPQVMCLQDVVISEDELAHWLRATRLEVFFSGHAREQLRQFEANTATFGSLIQPVLGADEIAALKVAMGDEAPPGELFLQVTHRKIRLALDQAEMLTQRYHVVAANPPYMGSKGMSDELDEWAKRDYPRSKADLYAMFLERNTELVVPNGLVGMVTMQTWMFLAAYEELRISLLKSQGIVSLVQIGYNSFPELNSKVAQACSFILKNAAQNSISSFVNLNNAPQSADKGALFLERMQARAIYQTSQLRFSKIPGSPIAYWVPEAVRDIFANAPPLSQYGTTRLGMATGNNDLFIRLWYEISHMKLGLEIASRDLAFSSGCKWFPYNKGGPFRRWYGNNDYVVDWEKDGERLQNLKHPSGRIWAHNFNLDHIFKTSITWSRISTSLFGVRYSPQGFLFDTAGSSIFVNEDRLYSVLGLLASRLSVYFLAILNPTVANQAGDVSAIPFINITGTGRSVIDRNVIEAIGRSKDDWDNFETSWDFRDLPLLRPGLKCPTLEASWNNWAAHLRDNIARMQQLETENNRLWIDAYGLQDELTPEVPEDEITLARPDRRKDVAAFLSYAVGCMMGRYALDKPGLILADAGDTLEDYRRKVGDKSGEREQGVEVRSGDRGEGSGVSLFPVPSPLSPSFLPDEDGIIPVLDGEWFDDDIVARTRDFLRVTFGEATLAENVRFIEEALGKDLRRYFQSDFYKDHLQTYKKRPIYWMFQSPTKGFQCLAYLHRYTRDTANRVLNRYLREYLTKLRGRIAQVEHTLTSEELPSREKTRARKESDQLKKVLRECEAWERDTLLPLAQRRIELDLDDGVKVNYLKLGAALAPIPGLAAQEE